MLDNLMYIFVHRPILLFRLAAGVILVAAFAGALWCHHTGDPGE